MLRLYIFLFFLFSTFSSFGQNLTNCEIDIRVENRTYYKQFFVTVNRVDTNILIKYKIRLSDNYQLREKDTSTLRIRDNFSKIKNVSPDNDTLLKVLDELDSVFLAYTTFRADSLILPRSLYTDYDNLIDNLFTTSPDSLQNSGHIYLDGTSFVFKLTDDKITRKVYANSINKDNHPQLAEFMSATMKLYRDIKKNDFLDKKSTAGY